MLQWTASCGIAVMIVSVGLLLADDFDDYVWHCCDHRVIIVVGFLRDCCEVTYVRLLWDCREIDSVLPCDCYGVALALLQYLCGITLELPRDCSGIAARLSLNSRGMA